MHLIHDKDSMAVQVETKTVTTIGPPAPGEIVRTLLLLPED